MAIADAAATELITRAGQTAVRDGDSADAIDGVIPARVAEPATPEALAAVLGWCSAHRQSVVVRGGGTKLDWGSPAASIDLALSTRHLSGILRYEPGDLTVTAGAGTTIDGLNRELAVRGQWLPIDARAGATTIGGAIATNESGPLAHRYGTPRDQLIGIRLAMPDGRVASAGGNVVKNVAGYDLGKLMAGSFGTLAAILTATFRLAPVFAETVTVIGSFRDRLDLAGAAAEISASQLDPAAVEIDAAGPEAGGSRRGALHLVVRFAGVSAVANDQASAAERLIAGFHPLEQERMTGDADWALWSHRARRVWELPGTIVKVSWMPAALADVIAMLDDVRARTDAEIELSGRGAMGTGLVRIAADRPVEADVVRAIRGRAPVVGNAVIVRADRALRSSADVWGLPAGTAHVTRLLKQQLDPVGVMNAGRGPA